MRKLIIILLSLLTLVHTPELRAEAVGEWQVYPSYTIATQNVIAGKNVYSLMNGNLLRYDTEDTSVKTYDCLNDLNDVHIAYMAYSSVAKRLILVYDNGNIDLMDLEDNIVNISSIKDKTMSNKEISSVTVNGNLAYLTTGFGFIIIDMKEGIVTKTYRLNKAITSMALFNNRYYLSMADGTYSIATDADLYDSSLLKKETSSSNIFKMVTTDDGLYALHKYYIYKFGKGIIQSGTFNFLEANSDGSIVFGNETAVYRYTTDAGIETITFDNTWSDANMMGKTYWVSEKTKGLRAYKLSDGKFVQTEGPIQPNSPVRDYFYRMNYVDNRLLIAGGIPNYYGTNHEGTAMTYENGTWTNFDESYLTAIPNLKHLNFTNIAQDPKDPNHHFVGSFRHGMYEFQDGKFKKLYNCDNSPIRSILPDNANYLSYCGAMGVKYDSEGRLWLLNNETDTIVRFRDTNGKWGALYYSEIAGTQTPTDYIFTSSGVNFVISRRVDGRGFFGFYTNNTPFNVRDDSHTLRQVIVNEDNTEYRPNEFLCMAEDLNGQVWCGTDLGLFIIKDPTTYFNNDFHFEQIKIAREDGSGLADYLLSGLAISCIAVDGANRKWIGTTNNGVYLVSADGQEMIHHFQMEDSHLLSNNILSIAVDGSTGRVMIGTDVGLCSYMGEAIDAEEQLDYDNLKVYPNPVSPDYSGPITIDGLSMDSEIKICSSSGQLITSGTSAGGRFTWNGCNRQGRRVSSGVYQVIANTSDGKHAVVARIIMIR